MMMGWGGGSAWVSVVGVIVGLAMLTAAVWLIRMLYRRPATATAPPGSADSPESPPSPPSPDSPESRAARGEMDADQLYREQHDAGRRGSGSH